MTVYHLYYLSMSESHPPPWTPDAPNAVPAYANSFQLLKDMLVETNHQVIIILRYDQVASWEEKVGRYDFTPHIVVNTQKLITNPRYLPPTYAPRLKLIVLKGTGTNED